MVAPQASKRRTQKNWLKSFCTHKIGILGNSGCDMLIWAIYFFYSCFGGRDGFS